jgi:predicted site-specific integrase-resolvase
MKCYSVSEAARKIAVNRATLQRWILTGSIPAPKAEIVKGKLVKCWSEKDIAHIRDYKIKTYHGKGMNRRKGSRASQKVTK